MESAMAGPEYPKTREEAKNSPFESLWQTPDHWPRHVRRLSVEDLGRQGVDPKTGTMYWDGAPVVTERRFSNVERTIAVVALVIAGVGSIAAVVQAIAAVASIPG
jgi:hypothetical protein